MSTSPDRELATDARDPGTVADDEVLDDVDMDDVADHFEEMMEIGADIEGEGQIEFVPEDD